MTTQPSPTLELLLRHRSLVRAIARDLLVDPDAADDVVQQTWIAALRHAGRGADVHRGLLARIATRLAFNRRREAQRRARRELVAAAPESTIDVARLVEQEEQRRHVVDAVFALDEPLRTTVLHRYFDERSEAEIAARMQVPLGTVRTRLRRARALLRERLQRDGDAPSSARAMVALAGWSADEAAAAIVAGKGIVVMSAKSWGVVAASLVLVGVGLWTIADPPSNSHEAAGAASASAVDDDPRRRATADDASSEARALDVAAEPMRTVVEGKAGVRSPTIVTGRCVNSARMPISGVTVWCVNGSSRATTDAAGRFEVELEPREPASSSRIASIAGSGAGYAAAAREYVVATATRNEIGDVTLVGSGSIRGVVRDESGAPLQADVYLHRGSSTRDLWWAARPGLLDPRIVATSPIGEFVFEDIPEDFYSVVPIAVDHLADGPATVTVRGGESTNLEFPMHRATAAQRIEVLVVDDTDAPIAGHAVRWWIERQFGTGASGGERTVFTNAEGRITVLVPDVSAHRFEASFGDGRTATVIDVVPGDPLVVLKKEAAPIANFTVVDDTTNEPCREVWVRLSEELRRQDPHATRGGPPNEDELRRAGEEALERAKRSREAPRDRPVGKMMPPPSKLRHWLGRTDAQGFASAPMPPNPFMVRIEIDAYEPFEAGPFDAHGSPPPTTIRLVPRRSLALRGRVTIDGVPADDIAVRVEEGTGVDRRTVSRTSTAMDGGFVVRPKPGVAPDAPLEVRASAPGRADAAIEFPTLDAAREASAVGTLELELPVGGVIAGTVSATSGDAVAGRVVRALSERGDRAWTRVAVDGAYRIEPLRAGRWRLRVEAAEFDPTLIRSPDEPFPDPAIEVTDGATTAHDVAWHDPRRNVVVEGSVAFGGRVLPNTVVRVVRRDEPKAGVGWSPGTVLDEVRIGPSGTFSIGIPEPGTFEVSCHVQYGMRGITTLRKSMTLAPGLNSVSFVTAVGSISSMGLKPSNGWVSFRGELPDGTAVTIQTACEADGSATAIDVPVGRYESFSFQSAAPFEVREGETTHESTEPAGG